MSENHCLICGGKNFAELMRNPAFPLYFGAVSPDKIEKVKAYPLVIAACENCSLVQQIDLLEENIIKEVYTADYYNISSPIVTGMGKNVIEDFYSFFREGALKKGKLLELACSDGYLLHKLQNDGWDVYGCDPSKSADIAIKNLGKQRVRNEYFNENTYEVQSFDVVIFRNLLEHMYDLHTFLRAVALAVKEDGNIFVEVPNINVYLKLGGFGTLFHQHVSYFSLETLIYLLSIHGFCIERYLVGAGACLFIQAKKQRGNRMSPTFSDSNMKEKIQEFVVANKKIKAKFKLLFNDPSIQRIGVFGASGGITALINILNFEETQRIKYIYDNDSLKHGKKIYGCDVIISPPDSLYSDEFDRVLISSYLFDKEIRKQLLDCGVESKKIVSFCE